MRAEGWPRRWLTPKVICFELTRLLLIRLEYPGNPVFQSVRVENERMYAHRSTDGLIVAVFTQPMSFRAEWRGKQAQVDQGGGDSTLPLDQFSRYFLEPAAAVLANVIDPLEIKPEDWVGAA